MIAFQNGGKNSTPTHLTRVNSHEGTEAEGNGVVVIIFLIA